MIVCFISQKVAQKVKWAIVIRKLEKYLLLYKIELFLLFPFFNWYYILSIWGLYFKFRSKENNSRCFLTYKSNFVRNKIKNFDKKIKVYLNYFYALFLTIILFEITESTFRFLFVSLTRITARLNYNVQ